MQRSIQALGAVESIWMLGASIVLKSLRTLHRSTYGTQNQFQQFILLQKHTGNIDAVSSPRLWVLKLNTNLLQTEAPVSIPKQILQQRSFLLQHSTNPKNSHPLSPNSTCILEEKRKAQTTATCSPGKSQFEWWKCWKDVGSHHQTQLFLSIPSYEQVTMGKSMNF